MYMCDYVEFVSWVEHSAISHIATVIHVQEHIELPCGYNVIHNCIILSELAYNCVII